MEALADTLVYLRMSLAFATHWRWDGVFTLSGLSARMAITQRGSPDRRLVTCNIPSSYMHGEVVRPTLEEHELRMHVPRPILSDRFVPKDRARCCTESGGVCDLFTCSIAICIDMRCNMWGFPLHEIHNSLLRIWTVFVSQLNLPS